MVKKKNNFMNKILLLLYIYMNYLYKKEYFKLTDME